MFRNIIGYAICLGIVFIMCTDRDLYLKHKNRNLIILLGGIALQVVMTLLLLHSQIIIGAIKSVSDFILKMSKASVEGTKFVFGYLGGDKLPFDTKPGISTFILGLQSFPMVIFMAVFFSILTYLKIMPIVSKILGAPFKYIFKISDSLGMVSVSKVLLGQFEAPLMIHPYLNDLKKNEMFIILSLAGSTSSASVMPVYADLLKNTIPNSTNYFIMANILNVITTLIICSVLIPKDHPKETASNYKLVQPYASFSDAMNVGLSNGTATWIAIVGSLLGMVALISFANELLATIPNFHGKPITLQRLAGSLIYPIVWFLEIPSADFSAFAQVVASKTILNEIVAMTELVKHNMSEASVIKSIFMIGNFCNISTMGITMTAMVTMAPKCPYIKPLMGKAFFVALISTIMTTHLVCILL